MLSLITWSQCKYYGAGWSLKKIIPCLVLAVLVFGGIETGLVFALRVGRDREHKWPITLMAVLAAVLLAGGVLRHYFSMFKSRSDAGMSLKFAMLDAGGDVASLLSVVFQSPLSALGLAIYGSELAIWIGLMVIVVYFRTVDRQKVKQPDATTEVDCAA